jgi:hypothetical protein
MFERRRGCVFARPALWRADPASAVVAIGVSGSGWRANPGEEGACAVVLASIGGAAGLNSVMKSRGGFQRRIVAASASVLREIVKIPVVSVIYIVNLLLVIVVSLQFVNLWIIILIKMIINQ